LLQFTASKADIGNGGKGELTKVQYYCIQRIKELPNTHFYFAKTAPSLVTLAMSKRRKMEMSKFQTGVAIFQAEN